MKEEPPSTKGMRPIIGFVMHNFIYWLARYHPEVKNLYGLPQATLLQLTKQFEESRPDIESSTAGEWLTSIRILSNETTEQDDYEEARRALKRGK